MPSVFVEQLKTEPVTVSHILFCIIIWLYQFDYDTRAEKFGQEYDKLIKDNEWWRCITSVYSHINLLHIIFNMLALWYLGVVEAKVNIT
jgi:membrane associated rhomboid family serine protease